MLKTLIVSSGFIAGIPHRQPDLSVVALNDILRLEPEPSNVHDPEAVKIIHDSSGQMLGYVPREQTVAIHQALSEGFEITSKVTCVQSQVKWKEVGYGAFVEVVLPSLLETKEDRIIELEREVIDLREGALS